MRVDQTLLTADILNLAVTARNAIGTHETRRLGSSSVRFVRPLLIPTLSQLCEERNEERNVTEFGRSGARAAVLVA